MYVTTKQHTYSLLEGGTVEEAVREYRLDMGLSESEISEPVVEVEHFEYR
jgi:hypothetical protein